MDTNSQLRYKELMSNWVYLIDHFIKRFKERVSKGSGKALEIARKAYLYGDDADSIEDKRKRERLICGGHSKRVYTIYRGFILIFELNKAITVFPISFINKEYKR